ncbi:MAG: D-glycerate dehydrogenase [Proteobacteria bacterium]|nr:D-glycerate dehydrogenase [Pseudomonadota bacterium]
MAKQRVVVTRKWPAEVEAVIQANYDVQLNEQDVAMTADELQEALRTADAVLSTVTDPVTAEVLSVEPLRAKFIGNFGVGYNNIDIDAAKARGITVTNTPEVLTDCTADIAMTLLLSAARRAGEGERHVRSKNWTGWRPTHMIGAKVTGQTLGLIGMGRIARAVAERAHFGFGMNILFSDPYPPPPEVTARLNAKECTMAEVLRGADFVSLHCPGGEETFHLIDTAELKMMKPEAILINSARGEVVNSEALISALRDGEIAAAGLDVFEGEPQINDGFLDLENVVLLPHLGSATRSTRIAMGNRVLENLHAYLAGVTPRDIVVRSH